MSELSELQERVNGARVMVKSARRTLQGLAQYLADLDERLEAFSHGQPEEAHRNEHDSLDPRRIVAAGVAASSAFPGGKGLKR